MTTTPPHEYLNTKLSREDEAKLALEHTRVSKLVAWFLIVGFLVTIVGVPIIQNTVEVRRNLQARREQKENDTPLWPQVYDVFALLPTREKLLGVRSVADASNALPTATQIKDYESALEDASVVNQWILPRAQNVLISRLGAGNEQAYPGRDHWLMYRPDVDYATHRGFLEAGALRARERAGDASSTAEQPDPVRAIVDFKTQLAHRGIKLLVVIAPVKAMIHPEQLAAHYSINAPALQNPSFDVFARELQRNGVLFFDATPIVQSEKLRTKSAQFLRTDTHWTPQAMETVAQRLARFITQKRLLPPRAKEGYTRATKTVSNLGDIAEMLQLPSSQTQFAKQSVSIHPVQTADGEEWYPRRNADILLLGDSFTNIYSLEGMNWGAAAGFGEQLSFALQRPLDRIAINAGGAFSSRQELWKDLKRGQKRRRDRLRGKKLVIYEFAARDLLIGDWKLLALPLPKTRKLP